MGEKKGFRKGEGRGGVSQRRSASHGSFNSLLLNSLLPLASLPWRTSITSISSLENQRSTRSEDAVSRYDIIHRCALNSDCRGPPQNIRCLIKFLTACCGVRGTMSIFSTSEAKEFLGVIISLFLDRQLQGLSSLLFEWMMAIISYFEDQEWNISCVEVAKSLASRWSVATC
ncbi:hypothetical protein NE237_017257 [Protea cynaroides]|uniref:Uncharacterized protein n=1 Tax=Protea cynaroides TaxID=273540 RepID=A0A9Q0K7P9_9MAGN|nr:hypothetical protein NE237_017257 [Protea cynaroides]